MDAKVLIVPLMLEREGLGDIVCKRLNIECAKPDLVEWQEMVYRQKNLSKSTIAL